MKTSLICQFLCVFCILVCVSCKTLQPTSQVIYRDSVVTEYRDSLIPGAIVHDTITISQLMEIPVNRWIVKKDTSGKVELTIMRDSLNRILVNCSSRDQLVQNLKRELFKSHQETITQIKQHQTFREKVNQWLAIIGIAAILLVCIQVLFFRK